MVCEIKVCHGGRFITPLDPVFYSVTFICESISGNVWILHDVLKQCNAILVGTKSAANAGECDYDSDPYSKANKTLCNS